MPWSTPTLTSVRQQNRDYLAAKPRGRHPA